MASPTDNSSTSIIWHANSSRFSLLGVIKVAAYALFAVELINIAPTLIMVFVASDRDTGWAPLILVLLGTQMALDIGVFLLLLDSARRGKPVGLKGLAVYSVLRLGINQLALGPVIQIFNGGAWKSLASNPFEAIMIILIGSLSICLVVLCVILALRRVPKSPESVPAVVVMPKEGSQGYTASDTSLNAARLKSKNTTEFVLWCATGFIVMLAPGLFPFTLLLLIIPWVWHRKHRGRPEQAEAEIQ
jgi:hypothetical protein